MVFSDEVCQLVSCTPIQLAIFRFMQKSVNTPSRLKTMDDVIDYIRKYRSIIIIIIIIIIITNCHYLSSFFL